MKLKNIAGVVVAAALAGGLVYFYGGSQAPVGQPPLHDLTSQNIVDIETAFNGAKDDVRALLLMSPT